MVLPINPFRVGPILTSSRVYLFSRVYLQLGYILRGNEIQDDGREAVIKKATGKSK
jgi:hypothetical protein